MAFSSIDSFADIKKMAAISSTTVAQNDGALGGTTVSVPPGANVSVVAGPAGSPWTVQWSDEAGVTHVGTLNPGESVTIREEDGTETPITADDAVPVDSTETPPTTTTTTTTAPPPAEEEERAPGVVIGEGDSATAVTETTEGTAGVAALRGGTLPDRPAAAVTITFSTLPDRPAE